jgi:hypothetical protein
MSRLLDKALERLGTLSEDEQDAIASQILASLADDEAGKARFAEKRDVFVGCLVRHLRKMPRVRRCP